MTTSMLLSLISEQLPSPHHQTNRSWPMLQSPSSPKHPVLGLWNPVYQGWLVSDVVEVHADSSIWTQDSTQAQEYRTESTALVASKHLRDFYGIDTSVSIIKYV